MKAKIFLLFLTVLIHCTTSAGQLRRTPKVYNALITTDDNLTPSRAFPVIQPTIHETGIASFPFGVPISQFRSYNPVVRIASPYPQIQYQQLFPPQNFPPVPDQEGPTPNELGPSESQPASSQQPMLPTPLPHHQGIPPQSNNQIPSFPGNEFGLPPSLIPLHQLPNAQSPIYLPPYGYPNYSITSALGPQGAQHYPESFLPPYDYFPPGFPFAFRPPSNKPPPKKYPGSPNKENAESSPEKIELSFEQEDEDDVTTQLPLKDIKNGNKDNKVPDVPPPPIPGKHKKNSQTS